MAVNNPMINLAVQGSPPGNRFPASDQMKTTERIVRLNDDTWLYEITTEDPVILTERSEEHTSELQSLMRISYAVFCLKKKTKQTHKRQINVTQKVIIKDTNRV